MEDYDSDDSMRFKMKQDEAPMLVQLEEEKVPDKPKDDLLVTEPFEDIEDFTPLSEIKSKIALVQGINSSQQKRWKQISGDYKLDLSSQSENS